MVPLISCAQHLDARVEIEGSVFTTGGTIAKLSEGKKYFPMG